MGMDPFTVSMLVGVAIAGVTSAMSMTAAGYAEDAEIKAAEEQFQFVESEVNRQQHEVVRAAEQEKSVRMAQADRELATLRVLSGERGASGSTAARLAGSVGFAEGLDLSRIDANRDARLDAGQASKRSGVLDKNSSILSAQLRKDATVLGAGLDFVGSGLQIGAEYNANMKTKTASQNKVT